jgi:3-oxoacyl-[acyl-carrier-protein] synthase III
VNNVRAAITGIQGYVPDYILTNQNLAATLDTSDEWIKKRTGICARHILKEPGKGTSDMGAEAVKRLFNNSTFGIKD